MKKNNELPSLEAIIDQTINAIETGKTQIFDISENARNEAKRIKDKLAEIQKKVEFLLDDLERMERLEKVARVRLMEVSKNIKKFNEEAVRQAYLNASNLQAEVKILRNQEKLLIQERTELERQYKRNQDTVAKAEQLVTHVGAALNYLVGNLQGLNDKLEEIEARGNLGSRIIKAQEEERRRVAREIHDGPAQSMANIVLRAEFCEKLLDKDIYLVKQELKQLKEMVRNSLKDVRKIIYDLRPMALDDLGLIPAVSRYIEDFIKIFNIKVSFSTSEINKRLPNTLEVAIFRVIQEALQNVQKHGYAKNVKINLKTSDEGLLLTISDNGQGFKVDEILADKERDGYGLLGMRERVELLKGEFNIRSEPGKGTDIFIKVPIKSPRS